MYYNFLVERAMNEIAKLIAQTKLIKEETVREVHINRIGYGESSRGSVFEI